MKIKTLNIWKYIHLYHSTIYYTLTMVLGEKKTLSFSILIFSRNVHRSYRPQPFSPGGVEYLTKYFIYVMCSVYHVYMKKRIYIYFYVFLVTIQKSKIQLYWPSSFLRQSSPRGKHFRKCFSVFDLPQWLPTRKPSTFHLNIYNYS